jgi:hypothetical protein
MKAFREFDKAAFAEGALDVPQETANRDRGRLPRRHRRLLELNYSSPEP